MTTFEATVRGDVYLGSFLTRENDGSGSVSVLSLNKGTWTALEWLRLWRKYAWLMPDPPVKLFIGVCSGFTEDGLAIVSTVSTNKSRGEK